MQGTDLVGHDSSLVKKTIPPDLLLVALSLVIQLLLAFFFGHAYDMKIFMATGYLVGTGQNPYIAQDLTAIFNNPSFQGMTTIGYPPPWSMVLGVIYLVTYRIFPNLLFYNLAIKLPIITANICLAYLVVNILRKLGTQEKTTRKAWLFMLINPFLLYASSAWGQFDSIVALFGLIALLKLSEGKLTISAILLALAIAFKPTALPLVPAVLVILIGKPIKDIFRYLGVLIACTVLFFVGPFALFHWDPGIILQNWDAHFTVGGGLTYMSFLEMVKDSYQLPGQWGLIGWIWVPALTIAALFMKPGGVGLLNLLKKSTVMILIFFLFRTWLSEPNILLVLPMILILTSSGELDRRALTILWAIPLVFSIFNNSAVQLLFPSMPNLMEHLLQVTANYRDVRLAIRTVAVIPWIAATVWIVIKCFKEFRFTKTLDRKSTL